MEREAISKIGNPNSLQYKSFVPKTTQKDSSFSTYLKPEPPKTGPEEDTPGDIIDDCDQISVFDAEDYFNEEKTKPVWKMENNETLEHSVANSRISSVSSSVDTYQRNYSVNSFRATPTSSSEASWNSQTGLLINPQGSVPKRSSKPVKNWFLMMRKCPCFCNKAVQVRGEVLNPTPISSVIETKKAANSTLKFDMTKSLNTAIIEPKNPTPIPPILYLRRDPNRGIDPIDVPQTQSPESQKSSFTSNEPKPEAVFSSTKSLNTAIIGPKNSTPIPPILYPKKDPNRGIDPIDVPQTQSPESQKSSFTSNEPKPEAVFSSTKSLNTAIIGPKNSTPIPPILYLKKDPNRGIDPIDVPQTQSSEPQRRSFTSNEQKLEPVFPNFRRFSMENQIPKTTHLRSSFPNTSSKGISFSFPILKSNSQVENIKDLPNPNPNPLSLEDPPRKSLEIFQPALERDCRKYPFLESSMTRLTSADDDVASDASSDLFEIDSFSYDDTKAYNRESIESEAATECYAPSEVSVEWSVATGEGYGSIANFSASVSQVGFGSKYEGSGGGVEGVTWQALGMGCRGEKAVSLGRHIGKEGGAW